MNDKMAASLGMNVCGEQRSGCQLNVEAQTKRITNRDHLHCRSDSNPLSNPRQLLVPIAHNTTRKVGFVGVKLQRSNVRQDFAGQPDAPIYHLELLLPSFDEPLRHRGDPW